MAKSLLPTVNLNMSTEGQQASPIVEHDVENALQRPLLEESKSAKGTNPVKQASTISPDPKVKSPIRYTSGIIRSPTGVVPDSDYRIVDNTKPPYHVENDYTILFKAVVAIIIYFSFGSLSFYLAEDDLFGIKTESFIDALYFCVVTLTTVGYGDLVPGTTLGKLFTSFYIFIGFGLVGALVSGAANYIVEMQEKMLIHSIKRKEHKDYAMSEEMDAEHAFWKVFCSGLMLLTLLVVGTVFLVKVEKLTVVDAIYCVCVTVTTLGYGDNSFRTMAGRVFAVIWILTGTVCVAQFFLQLAEWRTFSRQLELAHWVLHRRTTQSDLQAADLDGDGVVGPGEFVVFKLKELGKIDDDDVTEILEEFHQLDYDRSGTISLDDLQASQGDQREQIEPPSAGKKSLRMQMKLFCP